MVEIFEPVLSKADGFKRVYLDAPGNGSSEAPDWIRSSDQVLDIVEQFIDKVLPDAQLLLAGYSYGGYLTLGLVHRRLAQIGGIMLLCPLIEPDDSKRHTPPSEIRKVNAAFFESIDAGLREAHLAGQTGMVVVQSRALERAGRVYAPAHKAANADFLNRIRENGYRFSFDILEVSFDAPSLVVAGKQDDSVGYLDAWALTRQFKRASFAVLDAAGHGLPIDQEVIFESMVREWIERVANSCSELGQIWTSLKPAFEGFGGSLYGTIMREQLRLVLIRPCPHRVHPVPSPRSTALWCPRLYNLQ
ncbi:alpha/beta hydrolase [Candidatus Thorarchaeota archaeon]|nr:MAG: alpha/beta hydrolase [Candidatus Thorarchaeota archaeon]